MPKGLTDSQLDEFIKRLDRFEQKQGSFGGKGLTIEEYTGGKAKDIPSLKKLIQDSYLSEMKEEIGQDFSNIETPVLFELLDYKFNTGRSVSDLASFSIGDSTLDQVNKSSNLKVSDWSKLNLDNLLKAKDQVYKTTKGYTLDNPNPTYEKSWKDRIGSTQANSKEIKDILTKAAGGATAAEKDSTASELNKRMAEMRGKGVSEIEEQEAKDSIPEGKMVNDSGELVDDPNYSKPNKQEDTGIEIPKGMKMNPETGDFEPDTSIPDTLSNTGIEIPKGMFLNPETGDFEQDPNYVPPADTAATDTIPIPQPAVATTDSLPTDSAVVSTVAPAAPVTNAPAATAANVPKQEGNKSLLNIDNLKLGYVDKFDPKTQKPLGKAKLVSEKEKREFVKKLKSISDKYPGLDSEDFLNIMLKENSLYNGDVLLLDQKSGAKTNDKGGRARGLIQFIPSTAKGLGLNQEDLATMSPADQLDYVDKFYQGAPKGSLKSYGDMYTYTFQPAAMGKGDDYVIGDNKGDAAAKQRYESNKNLDKNGDGKITKGEFAAYAQKNIPSDSIPNLFSKVTPEQYEENNKKIAADTFVEDTKPVGVDTPFTPLGFQESIINPNPELDKNGKPIGGDKYVTKITDPNGVTKELFTDSPLKEEIILGQTYYSQKDGNRIYKLTDEYEKENYVFKDYNPKEKKEQLSKQGYKVGKYYTDRFSARENVVNERAKELREKSLNEGLTAEEYNQALIANKLQNVYHNKRDKERSKQGFGRDKIVKDDKIYEINNQFGNDILYPELRKRVFDAEKRQEEILEGAEKRLLNGEITEKEYDFVKTNYDNWEETHKADIEQIKKWGGNTGGTLREEQRAKAKATNYKKGFGLNNNQAIAKAKEMLNSEDYTHTNTPEEQNKIDAKALAKDDLIVDPAKNNADNIADGGSIKSGVKTVSGVDVATTSDSNPEADEVDAGGMVAEDATINPETAAYLDEDYLLKQNQLDQETIDFIKGQKEFNAELPEEESDYSNLLGNITDISKGLIGAAGAMEEVPEYSRGDMFNEYSDDARRMKDQGLSAQEKDYMTNNAERAFAYGMQQYRGTGAAGALVGAGQQASILQNQYGSIAAQDQNLRRQNRQNFAQAAVRDEQINRQIFQDKFNQKMANKKEGAALARDAYTNMNERAQFEKQYGKGSQYSQLMNEQTLSLREAREARKQSAANQKQQSISVLEQNKLDRQAKIDEYNKK